MFFFCYYIYSRLKNLIKYEKKLLVWFFFISTILTIFFFIIKIYFNYDIVVEFFSKIFHNLNVIQHYSRFLLFNFSALYFFFGIFFFKNFFFNKKNLIYLIIKKTNPTKFNIINNIWIFLNIINYLFILLLYIFLLLFSNILNIYKFLFIILLILLYILIIFIMHSYTSFVHYNFIWNGNFGFDKILRLFRQLILSIYYWIIFFIINYFYNWICNFIFPKSLWNFWQLYFFNFINIFGDNGIIILFFFIFFLFFLLSLLYFFSLLCLINIISSLVITIFFDDCFYKRYDKYLFNFDFIKNSNLFNKECETNIQKKKTIKKLKIPLFSKKFYLNLCLILLFIFFIFKIITGILCLN